MRIDYESQGGWGRRQKWGKRQDNNNAFLKNKKCLDIFSLHILDFFNSLINKNSLLHDVR